MTRRKSNRNHRTAGTFRSDRHGPAATVPRPGTLPRKPAWLKGEAAKIWKRLAPALHERDLLDETTAPMLAVWCTSLATWIDACGHLETEGEFVTTASGDRKRNEWAKVRSEVEATVVRLAGEFGLTPTALWRLGIEVEAPKTESGKSRFFKPRIATRDRSA